MTIAKFTLRSNRQKNQALTFIDNLPIKEEAPLDIFIEKHSKVRSVPQNSKYWSLLKEISESGFVRGKQFSKDVWHEYLRVNVMSESVENRNGIDISKWEELPSFEDKPTEHRVISTSQLSVRAMSEYMLAIEAFAITDLGITLRGA